MKYCSRNLIINMQTSSMVVCKNLFNDLKIKTMKNIILIIVILANAYSVHSQRYIISNATQAGGHGWDVATGLALLPDGRLALAGAYYDYIGFGGDTLFSEGCRDAFIAVYNSDGTFDKAIPLGGKGYDYITNLGASENGIMASLRFNHEAGYGKIRVKGLAKENSLALLFDHDLNLKSHNQVSSPSPFGISGLQQEQNGEIQFTGWFADSLFVDGKTYIAGNGSDIFRGAMSPGGNFGFKHYLNEGVDRVFAMAKSATGGSYMAGVTSMGNLEGAKLPSAPPEGMAYMFISTPATGSKPENISYPLYGYEFEPVSMLHDSLSLWVLVNFRHSLFIDGVEVVSYGMGDVLLLKYDLNGGKPLYYQFGGYGHEEAAGLVKMGNEIVLTGKYTGKLSFASREIETTGFGMGIFIAGFGMDCSPIDLFSVPVTGSAFPTAIAANHDALFIAGQFRGTLQTRNMEITSVGDDDIFILRIENCGARPPVAIRHKLLPGSKNKNTWELDAGAGFVSYAWNNNLSSSRYLMVDQPGTYRVTVTEATGCTRIGEITLVSTKSAEIEPGTETEFAFRLYPSLTRGMVYWEPATAWENKQATIRIIDATGRTSLIAETGLLVRQAYPLDLGRLPEGNYLVEISGQGFRETAKVIVSK